MGLVLGIIIGVIVAVIFMYIGFMWLFKDFMG